MRETTDYCFSFFRKPIQNIEPMRAIGIVDVSLCHRTLCPTTNREPAADADAILSRSQKGTKPPILTIVLFFGIIPKTE